MPLYNEEASIQKTVLEWISELRQHEEVGFSLLLIDDGSTDSSLDIIKELGKQIPEIIIKTGPNQGHGKSCLDGYRFAFENKYDFILQLDSDGQCDPKYFHRFLYAMTKDSHDAVYGLRYYRKDGLIRYAVSRILSILAYVRSGVWVFDPNVPYRLFRTGMLERLLAKDASITLYNVYLALYHKSNRNIKFIPIIFRDRWGGSPSVKMGGLWTWGRQFWIESAKLKF